MTTEEKKLNNRYFKLLADFQKFNKKALEAKKEMQQIRQKITPVQILVDERHDEVNMK